MSSYSTNVNVSPNESGRPSRVVPRRTVAGVLHDLRDAELATDELKAAGFAPDQIGVAIRGRTVEEDVVDDSSTRAAEGAVTGALGGGLVGGLAGLLTGLVALAVPGAWPLLAGGALVASFGLAGGTALAGAGIGVAAGGIIGALINMGIPEEDARYFETGVSTGGILITVDARNRAVEALDILVRNGADTGPSTTNVSSLPGGQTLV